MNAPHYRIYPLRHGRCRVAGHHAFLEGDPTQSFEYALQVFLVLGGEDGPLMVDVGLVNIEEMNRGAAGVLQEPITQRPDETVAAQLAHFGLAPADIRHVFITHLHFDHIDGLDAFTTAQVHIGRREWELATANNMSGSWGHGRIMFLLRDDPDWSARLRLHDDGPVLPGISCAQIGGHTLGSTAWFFDTDQGCVATPGDTISLRANLEQPVGVCMEQEALPGAMETVRTRAEHVLASHDPQVSDTWPLLPPGAIRYTIRALYNGYCRVRNHITFQDGDHDETSVFNLYVWVLEGGPAPVLVETGPRDPAAFSQATAAYIPGGVVQQPEEYTPQLLARAGIDPAAVSHVLVAHLHGDHYDFFDLFPNARLVVNREEYTAAQGSLAPPVQAELDRRPEALRLVTDEEVLPGIRTVPLPGHTDGSQGILVQTWRGPVMLTGDLCYLYENVEADRPINSADPERCRRSMARVRELADIVLPAHDPLTLVRWPGGIIGARQI